MENTQQKHNGSVFKGTKNVSCGNDKLIVNNKKQTTVLYESCN